MSWSFAGAERVNIDDDPALSLPTTDWTIQIWKKYGGIGSAPAIYSTLASHNLAFTGSPYWFWAINDSSGRLEWWSTSGNATAGGFIAVPDTWVPYLILAGSDGGLRMFVNGVQQSGAPIATSDPWLSSLDPPGPACIGDEAVANRYPIASLTGEFAKWDRALTQAEISDMADNNRSALFYPTDLAVHIPAIDDFTETVAGLTLTNQGAVISPDDPNLEQPGGPAELDDVYIGPAKASEIYAGASPVSAVYVGTQKIWGTP